MNRLGKFCPSLTHRYISIAPGTHLPPDHTFSDWSKVPSHHLTSDSLCWTSSHKSPYTFPTDLQVWLSEKHVRSVIYISMGSHMPMTDWEFGAAIVKDIVETSYSAVWALRNSTLLMTLGVQLDRSEFFVTSWPLQLSVLDHKSVGMAILHGGANGVHEALYNEVPVIIVPQFGDQFMLAGRISHNKLGIHIPSKNLSILSISDTIKEIDGDEKYIKNIKQLKKVFIQAGGVEQAADLVEHLVQGHWCFSPCSCLRQVRLELDSILQHRCLPAFGYTVCTLASGVVSVPIRCCTCFQSKEKAD